MKDVIKEAINERIVDLAKKHFVGKKYEYGKDIVGYIIKIEHLPGAHERLIVQVVYALNDDTTIFNRVVQGGLRSMYLEILTKQIYNDFRKFGLSYDLNIDLLRKSWTDIDTFLYAQGFGG
jgi:hypothetical protein